MAWKRFDTPGWHGRKDYIKLNTKAIYVPQWTLTNLFKDVRYVEIWYDAEEKAISLRATPTKSFEVNQGVAIAIYGGDKKHPGKHGNIGTSLARVMPKGWYIYKEDTENIFVLGKEQDALRAPIEKPSVK